ncbi:NADH:ubiquinone reductase (H(+)-translocating) [Scedosporium apiospermum]|uniref:NADH:ubiquinone reductase (H(+)-translocating) n=1 Tax=Pseudallescheria apiosperma TaxID=563466 RepID=A0A084G6B1_PSEDA|nr:NADH:ubiquinone reductase (H(+)-translocating) [Scedosporium apiospermum]KEZ42873.1 NADH:ubiquinone reductase (H(+)-translocating) [Scedosporium apiospermum]
MASHSATQEHYEPKDAVKEGVRCGAIGAGSGLFLSAIQNSLSRRNLGMMTVFTRTGHLIGFTSIAIGALGFTITAAANLREKEDHWNAALGGAVGGAIAGLSGKRMPLVVGCAAGLATVLGVFEYTGGRFDGYFNRSEEDEFERKTRLRENRRRPIEETIRDVGEGRGICPPGYEERRRERIKEKYGFEVNPVKATVD